MERFTLIVFTTILSFFCTAQDSLNLKKLGQLRYDDVPHSQRLNDIWGYVDEHGAEYAIVGLKNGVSVVAIDSLGVPSEVARIPGPKSTWRDLKTHKDFAFVVHDFWGNANDPQGLLTIDLRDVENGNVKVDSFMFADSLTRAHNIYIDEKGIAYLTGSNIGDETEGNLGGAYMVDVNDPENPVVVGNFGEYYLHDCVTRGDIMWGGAIYEGALVAVDVADKTNPEVIGYVKTPNLFTHNCWFSDDGNYVYTTDEKSDATVASYDVSDVGNIEFLDKIQSFYSKETIPHNTHFFNNYLITSYYRDGLQIVDAQYPDNLIDVGHYDTSPQYSGNGFNGAWGAYPYLPSGRILVSDMENGLFVMEPTYKRGSYLEIKAIDSLSGKELIGAKVEFLDKIETIGVQGVLKTGSGRPGVFPATVSFEDYISKTVDVTLTEDNILEVEVPLVANTIDFDDLNLSDIMMYSPSNSNTLIINSKFNVDGDFHLVISNVLGQIVFDEKLEGLRIDNQIEVTLTSGTFVAQLMDKNKNRLKQIKFVKN